ncbi:MAG: serine hydrolase domain-containing protein [Rhodoferax sp.]|uniref:serine hydrolase domain-containing protein n=1 Tax=Rhodoferax sp. TaxID=50421 RepID=UPI00272617B2|nr:serine hydrolase domain-containing protein [Rhodoferax sp.]MDO8449199.1 serine hydrolase domain-containing protein [Rhodoferax sp.]
MKNMWSNFSGKALRGCVGAVAGLWLSCTAAQQLTFGSDPTLLAKTALGEEQGSVAVGVWRDGQATYAFRQNGAADRDSASAPSAVQAQQLYEIGSISKVFTGLLLAQAVEKGDLTLEDKLGALLQGKATLTSPEVASITLRQLITHSACVPRLPPDFSENYVEDNPYATYDRRRLWFALSSLKLKTSPPCAAAYSNFGLGMVGEILSERYGKPWHVLVRENITSPLGMSDTVQLLGDKAARMAQGFNNKTPTSLWDFQALAGAGALRSTAADMLIFSRAIMAGPSGPLGPAVERLLTPLGRYQSGQIGYAVMMRGPAERRTFFHGGGTGGYRTLWMVAPDTQEAVVAFTSNAHAQANKILVSLTATRYPVVATTTVLGPDQLAEYAGVFRIDEATAFTFVLQDGALYRRITGGGFRPLLPAGPNTFTDAELGVQYVFTRQAGVVTGVDYTHGGGSMSGTRTNEPVPAAAVVPIEQQQAYVGRFHLARLLRRNLDFDVKAEGGQLAVRSRDWPRQPVFPMAGQPDRFTYEKGIAQLQFERDASGKVVALVLHEGGAMRMQRQPE